MGFRLPEKSITSGTSAHSSALKMKEKENAASALKQMELTKEDMKGSGYTLGEGKDSLTVSATGKTYTSTHSTKGGVRSKRAKPVEITLDKNKPEDKAILSSRWKKGKKASGGTLDELVKQRKGLDKGSSEYAAIQNQINKALGSKKLHGVTETTEGKQRKKGGGTTTTKTTPGVATTVTERKRGAGSVFGGKTTKDTEYGPGSETPGMTKSSKYKTSTKHKKTIGDVEGVRKAKTNISYKDDDRDVTVKTKYDKAGEKTKEKRTVKDEGIVTKTKTKGDKTKTKTRKKGGTGLGAKIKGIFTKKNK